MVETQQGCAAYLLGAQHQSQRVRSICLELHLRMRTPDRHRRLKERRRAARDGVTGLIQPKLDEMEAIDDRQAEAADVTRAPVETNGQSAMTNVLQSKAVEIDERFKQLTVRRELILRKMQREQITDSKLTRW